MKKKIFILSGSPKKDGNTSVLIDWFVEGAKNKNTEIEAINVAGLKYKSVGCISCRACQKLDNYECVINDDVKEILQKIGKADVIVMATPLYFFSASAQLKIIIDRMFSLFKWDNKAGTMKTILEGKTFVLIASAYEDVGLNALQEPFSLTAKYAGMKYKKLLIPCAGVSGDIKNNSIARAKAIQLGREISDGL